MVSSENNENNLNHNKKQELNNFEFLLLFPGLIWFFMFVMQIVNWFKTGEWSKYTLDSTFNVYLYAGNLLGLQKIYDWITCDMSLSVVVFILSIICLWILSKLIEHKDKSIT